MIPDLCRLRKARLAQQAAPAYREVTPAEWAPWSLLSAGAVVTLYSFTIPAKLRS